MQIPWYLYVIGILVALPCYFLWAIGAYGIVKAVLAWVFMPETPPAATPKVTAKG